MCSAFDRTQPCNSTCDSIRHARSTILILAVISNLHIKRRALLTIDHTGTEDGRSCGDSNSNWGSWQAGVGANAGAATSAENAQQRQQQHQQQQPPPLFEDGCSVSGYEATPLNAAAPDFVGVSGLLNCSPSIKATAAVAAAHSPSYAATPRQQLLSPPQQQEQSDKHALLQPSATHINAPLPSSSLHPSTPHSPAKHTALISPVVQSCMHMGASPSKQRAQVCFLWFECVCLCVCVHECLCVCDLGSTSDVPDHL